ncbi:hypothetical protein LCGC14_0765540 [marine sediment metagenome]|uniref:N-acetyltransferase domain-containing protein n=1 Tax=marine sediment metagenome TaxID=412755 RepID=A0A0F9SJW2_9ZZZZ|nr:MAG: hypothetical protein Lokiarch_43080 [Candidatus Lokiarchaeum sp. GC14_75]HEC38936.1 GNAT family N-acetyltransferase [bacterium]
MKGNFKLRKLTEDDRGSFQRLTRYAFDASQNSYDNLVGPLDKVPIDLFYGAFDENLLVAGLVRDPYEIRMRSRDFKMYGISWVATKPEYRNRGLVKALILDRFEEMHENHIPTSKAY